MLEVRQHRVAGFSGPLLLVAHVVGERDREPDPVADVVLTNRVGAFGGQVLPDCADSGFSLEPPVGVPGQ